MNLFSSSSASPYRLFISHAWQYNDDYEGVKSLLNADWNFRWEDLSVPFDDPLGVSVVFPRSYGTIVDQLRDRIRNADALLVIAGMYCAYRGWIQTEMEAAKQHGKPVIAIRPWGQERLPLVIQEADEEVGWRTASIVDAIRRLATPKQEGLNAAQSLLDAVSRQSAFPLSTLPSLDVVGQTAYSNLASLIGSVREPSPTPSAVSFFEEIGRYRSWLSQNSLQNALEASGMFTIAHPTESSASTSLLEALANYPPGRLSEK
jgi:hypothetical protein